MNHAQAFDVVAAVLLSVGGAWHMHRKSKPKMRRWSYQKPGGRVHRVPYQHHKK